MRATSFVLVAVLVFGLAVNAFAFPLKNELGFDLVPRPKDQINYAGIQAIDTNRLTFTCVPFGEEVVLPELPQVEKLADGESVVSVVGEEPQPAGATPVVETTAQPVVSTAQQSDSDLALTLNNGVVSVQGAPAEAVVVEEVERETLSTAVPAVKAVTADEDSVN